MRISLVTMAGRCLAAVVVDASDEKEDIVRHIPGLVGCPPELRLFHGSRELAPGESLEAVGVVDGSLLSVMMQARAPYVLVSSQQHGGAPPQTWDMDLCEPIATMAGGAGEMFNCADISPDGRFLVTGTEEGEVAVWFILTGEQRDVLRRGIDAITSVACSFDGDFVAMSTRGASVEVLDMKTGRCLYRADAEDGTFIFLAWMPTSGRLLTSDDGYALLMITWQSDSHAVRFDGHGGHVTAARATADEGYLVSASLDASVRVWSVSTAQCLRVLRGHTDHINSMALQDDLIVTGSRDGTIRLWSFSTGVCTKTLHEEDGMLGLAACCVTAVSVTPDGGVVASGTDRGRVTLWQTDTGRSYASKRRGQNNNSWDFIEQLLFAPRLVSLDELGSRVA